MPSVPPEESGFQHRRDRGAGARQRCQHGHLFVVNAVLRQPLPYPEPDPLVRGCRQYPDGLSCNASIPKFLAWSRAQSFEAVAAYDFAGPGMNLAGERPEQVRGIHVSSDYFRVFGATTAVRLAAIGLVLGLAGAFGAARVIRRGVFGVQPTDVPTFVAVAVGPAAIAFVASYVPVRRATRVDPLIALQSE
jgi:hypothetical protein